MEIRVANKGLTGNQLKLIAVITMTIDHIGLAFFPQQMLFRVIGRLAFPIYAYMIAEGCRYTRSMGKYLRGIILYVFNIRRINIISIISRSCNSSNYR